MDQDLRRPLRFPGRAQATGTLLDAACRAGVGFPYGAGAIPAGMAVSDDQPARTVAVAVRQRGSPTPPSMRLAPADALLRDRTHTATQEHFLVSGGPANQADIAQKNFVS